MTQYVAAYDTESPNCLTGVRRIVEVHEQHDVPATFFIVAGLLEKQKADYVALLRDHPLFEIACHTYSHMPLVDTPRFGKAGPVERFPHELVDSKKLLEDTFGVEVVGFRPPVSAPDGLRGRREALAVLQDAGYSYISSAAWGPDFSMPAPLRSPYTYAEEGYPDLWELPPCGWQENLLKGHNKLGPILLCLFPAPMPETIPDDYVKTPEEEFLYNNKPFIDRAVRDGMPLVSLVWHPWSLNILDPTMCMLDVTFEYVKSNNLKACTFGDLWAEMRGAK